jgi:hypothetical protein
MSGSFGEVVVVMSKKSWDGPRGDSVYALIGAPLEELPAPEPSFSVIHVSTDKFSSVLRTHRNVFIPEISKEKYAFTPPALKLEQNVWAKGQIVLTLTAANTDSLYSGLRRFKKQISRVFMDAELNRRMARNKEFGPQWLSDSVKNYLGIELLVQKDFEPAGVRDGVMWIRLERARPQGGIQHQISQGVLLFSQPYQSKAQLLDTFIMNAADSILSYHIQGSAQGSFMKIDRINITPAQREINHQGSYAREIRGIWRMEKNYFGGPFYLLAILDEKNSRVIYAYGYVYAPQFEKRDYLLEVQSIIRSLKPAT